MTELANDVRRIEDYALLSNCRGTALVDRRGTIEWACLDRFDGPACFAKMLGPDAGHWTVAPIDTVETSRRYLETTMVLETVFRTDGGEISITDLLPLSDMERGHQIGRHSPAGIVRVIDGRRGRVEVAIEIAIRPEYGLTTPTLMAIDGGIMSRGGPEMFLLTLPENAEIDGGTVRAVVAVEAGQRVCLALQSCDPFVELPTPWTHGQIAAMFDATVDAWRSWSKLHQAYRGFAEREVHLSGLVLQSLTYSRTGAVVAAPTSSLPESLGGSRNWDYRYCWVRDASLTLDALWIAACPDEAAQFFDFFVTAAGGSTNGGAPLQIMYGVGGERLLPEAELDHLAGFADSRPVRVGNGAWDQEQLDVYGELLMAAHRLVEQVGTFDPAAATFLAGLADAALARWQEPDQGIWEVRGGARHFTYSKLMCWAALDRAVALASVLGAAPDRVERWRVGATTIRADILERSWSDRRRAFAQSYGSDDLDASVLMMPIVGIIEPDDPRMLATLDAIVSDLTDARGFVFRYRGDDGLDGDEGTFSICTFWLAQALAMAGRIDEAKALFAAAAACANDVGLLAEEVDSATGHLLGNFPQAFTHIGLVNAAYAIEQHSSPVETGGKRHWWKRQP